MDFKTFIETVAERSGISFDEANELTSSLAEIIGKCGMEQDTIAIPSFGSFEPKQRQERISVHPASGKRLLIPPKIVMGFKPSAVLKTQIR